VVEPSGFTGYISVGIDAKTIRLPPK
jgi:hypothetical protein